ncbi:MAG: type II CRISPR RNA-guided endonuclease Cas9 [Sulfuricellaceae bacterium]
MAKKYRLGLDVGTASVGAAAVELNDRNEPVNLAWHLVRIFDEPLEKGQGGLASKKAGRRQARMQRRQIDRSASRLRRIAHLSALLGLKHEEIPPDDGNHLPHLRADAAVKRVALADLLRIFLRLSKRRGYKGEFKAKQKGEVAEGSGELENAMKTLAEERGVAEITLGQYLLHRLESGLPAKLKVKEQSEEPKGKKGKPDADGANAPKNLYALRRMVEREFDILWQTQSAFHDVLNGLHDGKPIREHFRAALFFQRPLKSAADLVAQCGLEPTLPRAPRAQIAFQRFRIEKTLADLRWGMGKSAKPLEPQQKAVIRELLNRHDKVKFGEIYEALEKAQCPRQGKGLNLERVSREELLGNSTLAALRQLDKHSRKHHPEQAANLEAAFRALDEKTQIAVINFLAELGSPEQLDDPEWHTCFVKSVRDFKIKDGAGNEKWVYKNMPRIFSPALVDFVNLLKEHEKFDRLNKMGFDGGRASYSIKALNKLADWLEETRQESVKPLDEEAAIRVCYPQVLDRETKRMDKLPTPNPTGNAVVDGALRQIRWTVNRMIAELGAPPSEIVVELAREMSLGITRRNERESDNNAQQRARRDAEKEIRAHGQTPTPSKIRRYLLWAEQDKSFCPYCNKTIGIADALSGATEFEHIIPKSLTQVGMKRTEIVLAHYVCNQEKGDRTPWDIWGGTDRWQSVEAAAARFEKRKSYRKAKLLCLRDFEREVLTDESVNEFADRQFHQTSWIAKEALQWLQCLCPNKVSVSRGELTAMLRRKWGLETVIPEARIEDNLPVLDDEGKPILAEDFARLKKHLEGHPVLREDREANPDFDFNRRPDKRLDHRHHLIDAITLALTSRGLFQQMAGNYKAAAEKMRPRDKETQQERERRMKHETRLRLEAPEPPLHDVRRQALAAVRECRISIKHDRYPAGRLFQDFAYKVIYPDGGEPARLARRKNLVDMAGDSVEQTRKNINDIVSPSVRRLVLEEFEHRLLPGDKTLKQIFSKPFPHPLYRTEIRKVFCLQKKGRGYISTDDTFRLHYKSRDRDHEKRLLHDDYACIEVRFVDGKFESAKPIRQQEAQSSAFATPAGGVVRYFKGDTLLDSVNGKKYLVRGIKKQGGGMLVMSPITETLGVDKLSSDFGLHFPSGKSLARFKLI